MFNKSLKFITAPVVLWPITALLFQCVRNCDGLTAAVYGILLVGSIEIGKSICGLLDHVIHAIRKPRRYAAYKTDSNSEVNDNEG